jgi:hypothetical protein
MPTNQTLNATDPNIFRCPTVSQIRSIPVAMLPDEFPHTIGTPGLSGSPFSRAFPRSPFWAHNPELGSSTLGRLSELIRRSHRAPRPAANTGGFLPGSLSKTARIESLRRTKTGHEAFPIKTGDNSSRIVGSGLISLERTFSRGRQDQTMSAPRTEAPYPRDVSVQLDLRHSRTERQDQS